MLDALYLERSLYEKWELNADGPRLNRSTKFFPLSLDPQNATTRTDLRISYIFIASNNIHSPLHMPYPNCRDSTRP